MTDQHPIIPPPELVRLVKEWWDQTDRLHPLTPAVLHIAAQAARWGADQELEACCEWLEEGDYDPYLMTEQLRAARRPKPLSLKEQALNAIDQIDSEFPTGGFGDTIRRALEWLP